MRAMLPQRNSNELLEPTIGCTIDGAQVLAGEREPFPETSACLDIERQHSTNRIEQYSTAS
jgi:hypothetical protein